MTNGHKRQVQALARGLGIMRALRDRGPSTLTEIAAKVNMDKSTVLRLLNTLSAQGFVERDPDRPSYRLGMDLISYGRRVTHDLQLRRVALPYLIRLQQISKERVGLAVLDSRRVMLVTVEVLESRDFPGVGLPAGVIRPFLHSTAQGKAMLAYLPERELEQIHKTIGFPRQTANTITTLEALREELHRTRERGYAFDNCENYDARCCVCAAI